MVTEVFTGALAGNNVIVWPSISGVTNWQHMSFSPRTGLLYINAIHIGMTYEAGEPPRLKPGAPSGAGTVKRTVVTDDPNVRGYLKAVDPLTGKAKWGVPYRSPNYSSTRRATLCLPA
jgi:alcohol dehydrogenase (cytochrome c)